MMGQCFKPSKPSKKPQHFGRFYSQHIAAIHVLGYRYLTRVYSLISGGDGGSDLNLKSIEIN